LKTEIYEENGKLVEKTTHDFDPDLFLKSLDGKDKIILHNFYDRFWHFYEMVKACRKALKKRENDENCCKFIENIIDVHLHIQMVEFAAELYKLAELGNPPHDRNHTL